MRILTARAAGTAKQFVGLVLAGLLVELLALVGYAMVHGLEVR